MEKSTKICIASGAVLTAAAAAGAAAHVMTKYLMNMAMDRQKPKSILKGDKAREKIRGTAYEEQFLKDLAAASERLKNSETEPLEILSRDGLRLVGHLRRAPEEKRIILAMHGWRSSWDKDFGMIADFWRDTGATVLYAEQRGQNDSGGDYMGFGMLERYDCADWANYIHDHISSTLPIYLAGVSMGASTVLMASCLELPTNVKGIAADCGYTSPMEIFRHITEDNLHLSYGLHQYDIDELCRKKIQLGPSDCNTLEALQKSTLPVMLVHGTEDTFVPVEMTYENYKACRGKRKLLIVPGADHGMSYYVAKDEYEKAATDFFKICET